jgi:hypothetical protein
MTLACETSARRASGVCHETATRRGLVALLLGATLAAGPSPVRAADPIVAQFWYSFGGKNREVTETTSRSAPLP